MVRTPPWGGGNLSSNLNGPTGEKMKALQVITTVDKEEKAKEIAQRLLDKQLAACVQIFSMNSHYRWKGSIEHAKEWMCFIKCRQEDYSKVEEEIKFMHPYDVPEIIAMPIEAANPDYLKWLAEETSR